MKIKRFLLPHLKKYLGRKILLISGPRQCGKTTVAKMISKSYDYINYDNVKDRFILEEQSWDRKKQYIIFDELHKKKSWKSWLKGVFDSEGIPPGLVVTGSARMDIYKKAGDSMAGRYFSFRLAPLHLKELCKNASLNKATAIMDKLLLYSGFPEPYMQANQTFYNLWEKTHIDNIIRQDLIDLESPRNITKIETLIELLKENVGNPVSSAHLAEKLEGCSPKTIQNWLGWLEKLYIVFKVSPYSKNISRSLKKMPKYYFYNWVLLKPNKGLMFENFIACALLKENQLREDIKGEKRGLYYVRNKSKQEIDFLLTKNQKVVALIEAKWSSDSLHPHFKSFSNYFYKVPKIQLVKELKREKSFREGFEIRRAASWLSQMPYQ
ncbi:MAG: ATP-binding protein [Bdellovibrionales bacterium]|nr:ATP-binding protein [Bdellovibrionales bacterium]